MNTVLNIYKPIGLTPVQLIQKLRITYPEYKDQTIGFAGRLDPLAHGVLLLMIGEETKNRDQYLGLSKTYEFEVLFGVETDTYDALGLLKSRHPRADGDPAIEDSRFLGNDKLEKQIRKFIKNKTGIHSQSYPPYSSKPVDGKPLFQWARENKLSEIIIPEHVIEIYSFNFLNIKNVSCDEIKNRIIKNINSVDGDFRQIEILKRWSKFFSSSSEKNESRSISSPQGRTIKFKIAKFRIYCSSGTYVRSLAHELGIQIETGAIAFDILRTKVGKYEIEDSLRI